MREGSWLKGIASLLQRPIENFRRLRALSNIDPGIEDPNVLWALRDVSFDVMDGEVLGVIGGNGAGKSTLLKILSRITMPTRGEADLYGKVSSLLEVGTGFHPELTGRENVFMNGTILGMSAREVRAKFEEIVEFSGVTRFIDTPVKWYSSGMRMRLAFSVAAHLDAPIMIVDEVLAVGDVTFQKKCLAKLDDVGHSGRTVLFVSHNLAALRRICTRALMLKDGRLVMDGPVDVVVKEYLGGDKLVAERVWPAGGGPGGNVVQLTRAVALRQDGTPATRFGEHEPIHLVMEFECRSVNAPGISGRLALMTPQGDCIFLSVDHTTRGGQQIMRGGIYRKTCVIPSYFLNEGIHSVVMVLANYMTNEKLAEFENAVVFEVMDRYVGGDVRGEYLKGAFPGAVRPMLDWRTETIAMDDCHSRLVQN